MNRSREDRIRLRLYLTGAALTVGLLASGCHRAPPDGAAPRAGESARDGGTSVQPKSPEAALREVAILREDGPSYTPYDRPPRIVWDEETEALLATTLLPVLQEHDLSARTRALYWLLVGADGQVHEVVLQTGFANEAFHRAGAEVAGGLRFAPAVRDGAPVAAWILQEISLVMQ